VPQLTQIPSTFFHSAIILVYDYAKHEILKFLKLNYKQGKFLSFALYLRKEENVQKNLEMSEHTKFNFKTPNRLKSTYYFAGRNEYLFNVITSNEAQITLYQISYFY
jgi:hypothetical protein